MITWPPTHRHEWFNYAMRFRMFWHTLLHSISLLFIILWNNNPTSEYLLMMITTQFVVLCLHTMLAQNEKKASTLTGHYIHIGMLLITPALLLIYGALWLSNHQPQWDSLWKVQAMYSANELPNTLSIFFFMLTSSSVALSLTYTLRSQYTPSINYSNKIHNTKTNPFIPDECSAEKVTFVAVLLCLGSYILSWVLFNSPLPAWILHISFFYVCYAYMENYLFMTSCNAVWYKRMIRYHKPSSHIRWQWLAPHQHDTNIITTLISGMSLAELLEWSESLLIHNVLVENKILRELWLNEIALHKPIAHIAWDLNPSLTYADTLINVQKVSTSDVYNVSLV